MHSFCQSNIQEKSMQCTHGKSISLTCNETWPHILFMYINGFNSCWLITFFVLMTEEQWKYDKFQINSRDKTSIRRNFLSKNIVESSFVSEFSMRNLFYLKWICSQPSTNPASIVTFWPWSYSYDCRALYSHGKLTYSVLVSIPKITEGFSPLYLNCNDITGKKNNFGKCLIKRNSCTM